MTFNIVQEGTQTLLAVYFKMLAPHFMKNIADIEQITSPL